MLTVEVNSLAISALLKVHIRDTLSGFVKRVVARKNEEAAAKTVGVTDEVIAAAEVTAGEKVPTFTK